MQPFDSKSPRLRLVPQYFTVGPDKTLSDYVPFLHRIDRLRAETQSTVNTSIPTTKRRFPLLTPSRRRGSKIETVPIYAHLHPCTAGAIPPRTTLLLLRHRIVQVVEKTKGVRWTATLPDLLVPATVIG